MAEIPKISMDIERKSAEQGLDSVIRRMKLLRKELGVTNRAVMTLNKQLGVQGLSGVARKSTESTKKMATQQKVFQQRLRETTKTAQIAFGPLSGIASRISAIGALSLSASSGVAAFAAFLGTAVFAGIAAFRQFTKFNRVMADVSKNVGVIGTPLQKLGDQLIDIAKESGLAADQVGKIADSAGRLGIRGDDLENFTRTIARLTLTTNLQGDEAATSLARLLNVTGESIDQTETLASVIAKLGASVAASETEIVNFAREVASAGAQFDLSSTDVVALGASFAALGRNAESVRTTILKTFTALDVGLSEEGTKAAKALESLFEEPLEALQERFLIDPTQFFADFVEQLRDAQNEGVKFRDVLDDIGIKQIRVITDLGASLKGVEALQKQIQIARKEEQIPGELGIQVARRELADTTKLDQALEGIKEAGIALGEVLAPAVLLVTDTISGLAGVLKDIIGSDGKTGENLFDLIGKIFKEGGLKTARTTTAFGRGAFDTEGNRSKAIIQNLKSLIPEAGEKFDIVQKGRLELLLELLQQQRKEVGLNEIQQELLTKVSSALAVRAVKEKELAEASAELKAQEDAKIREEKSAARQRLRDEEFRTGPVSSAVAKATGAIGTRFQISQAKDEAERIRLSFTEQKIELDKLAKDANLKSQQAIIEAKSQLDRLEQEALRNIVTDLEKASIKSFEGIFRQFQRGFSNAIFQAFRATEDRNIIGGFVDAFADIFTKAFSDIAAQNLTTGFIAPLFSSVAGAFAGEGQQGTINQAIANVTGLSVEQVADSAKGFEGFTASLKGAKESIDKFGETTLGVSDLAENLFTGFGIGVASGGGLLGGAGGAIGKVIGESISEPIAKAVSSQLGDSLGQAAGQIAGPLVAFAVSKFVESLKDSPDASAFLGLVGGKATTVSTASNSAKAPVQEVLNLGNQFADLLNEFATILDTDLTNAVNSLEIFINTGKKLPFRIIAGGGEQQKFATAEEAVVAAIQTAFTQGAFQVAPEAVKQVVREFQGTDVARLGEIIVFAADFATGFGALVDPLTEFQKELETLGDFFDDAAKQAEALGLSIQAVEQSRLIQLTEKRLDFDKGTRLGILDILNPEQAALERLAEEQQIRLTNAEAIGANIVAVERLNALEREQIIKQFATNSRNILQDFLTDITATTQSKLPTETVLANAQRNFSEVRAAFLGGDTSVASELVEAGRNLLDVRRQFSASGPEFFATQNFIESTLRSALEVQASQVDPQLEILQELSLDTKEGNETLTMMRELLEALVNGQTAGGTNPPGFSTTPGPNSGGNNSGPSGGSGRPSQLALSESVFPE